MPPEASPRARDVHGVFNAPRRVVHAGAPWRYRPGDLPGNLPPWRAVYQQTRHWLAAGRSEAAGGSPMHGERSWRAMF